MIGKRTRCTRLIGLVSLGVVLVCNSAPAKSDTLSGVWRMESYTGGGSLGPATGLITFADGHFTLIYTMTVGEQTWGRAHAGTYSVLANTLVLDVAWTMQYVPDHPSASHGSSTRTTRFAIEGKRLKITFENGAVQMFSRVKGSTVSRGDSVSGRSRPVSENARSVSLARRAPGESGPSSPGGE